MSMDLLLDWTDSGGVQHLYSVAYQDELYLRVCVCLCVCMDTVVWLPGVDRNVKLPCFWEI